MSDCTAAASKANQESEHQKNVQRVAQGKPTIHFAFVDVTIVDVTSSDVVFITAGEDNQKHRYRIPKKLLFLDCPSTARAKNDHGVLLISEAGLDLVSEDTPQTRIFGSTGSPRLLSVKWPDPGDSDPLTKRLSIWPTSIVVKGYAVDDPVLHAGEVELVDAALAGFTQAIAFDRGAEIELKLTEAGLGQFQMGGLAEERLQAALTLVKSKFNNDLQERAAAWQLIARWQRYVKSPETQAREGGAKIKGIELQITDTLVTLQ